MVGCGNRSCGWLWKYSLWLVVSIIFLYHTHSQNIGTTVATPEKYWQHLFKILLERYVEEEILFYLIKPSSMDVLWRIYDIWIEYGLANPPCILCWDILGLYVYTRRCNGLRGCVQTCASSSSSLLLLFLFHYVCDVIVLLFWLITYLIVLSFYTCTQWSYCILSFLVQLVCGTLYAGGIFCFLLQYILYIRTISAM